MALSSASAVRAPASRSAALTLRHANSMGEKSGEYVRRQEQQPGTGRLNRLAHLLAPVAGGVVQDHYVTVRQAGRHRFPHERMEAVRFERAGLGAVRFHALAQGEQPDHAPARAGVARHREAAPLALLGPAVGARQPRVTRGLVDELQPLRGSCGDQTHLVPPSLAPGGILLGRPQ